MLREIRGDIEIGTNQYVIRTSPITVSDADGDMHVELVNQVVYINSEASNDETLDNISAIGILSAKEVFCNISKHTKKRNAYNYAKETPELDEETIHVHVG